MIVTPIRDPLAGERILAVDPPMALTAETAHRRLNFFAGRALSDAALTVEQNARAGRLALRGQMVSPGIVSGLEASLEGATLHVQAGLGIAASGEDVIVPKAMQTPLREVIVAGGAAIVGGTAAGMWTLDAVLAAGGQLPPAAILTLQPANAELVGEFDPADQCERDPRNDAFEDWQRVDACRLVLVAWPTETIALPLPGDRWRNRLAYAVFDAERLLAPDAVLPWEEVGVPIGLIGFDAAFVPLFADRYAVARAGGRGRQRTSVVPASGSPRLWQARIQQFAEQVSDAQEGGRPIAEIAADFRYLPPVGLLPTDAAEPRAGRGRFFPASWDVQAVPVPLEQLDVIVRSSASLREFDTFSTDGVEVLFPVPQVWYEPRLLVIETVDPEFQQTLDQFVPERAMWLARRADVRDKAATIGRAITGTPPAFPTPDPDALEEEAVATGPLVPPEDAFETAPPLVPGPTAVALEAAPLRDLRTQLQRATPLAAAEIAELDTRGVAGFITFLQDKVDRANDKIDFGFLRAQTDIYRVRQLVLGATEATRLATSPALATIAKGETAAASREELTTLFKTLKTGGPVIAGGSDGIVGVRGIGRAITVTGGETVAPRTVAQLTLEAVTEKSPAAFVVRQPSSGDIADQGELVGGSIIGRTVTVAQRLQAPFVAEAKGYTVATKADTVTALGEIDLAVDDLVVPGFRDAAGAETTFTVGALKGRGLGVVAAELIAGQHDPNPVHADDEAGYLTAGVRAIDNSITILRALEGRVAQYKRAIDACRKTLTILTELASRVNARLAVIANELAESRQDVSVARALLAEETARLAVINERRDKILAEHVTFLAYHRPRAAEARVDAPARDLDPGLVESPVPACLARALSPPPELGALLDLLREAPVKWFVYVHPLLDRLDRLDVLHATVQAATIRAAAVAATAVAAPVSGGGLLGQAIAKSFTAQQDVVSRLRVATAQFDLGLLAGQSWTASRDRAREVLSLGDLIAGGHGRPDLSQQVAREVDTIGHVAACLYGAFGEVLPSIRLDWAERLGQYDGRVTLRNLGGLPRWGEIEFLHRYEMQSLVDWLFQRVEIREPEAVSMINDLVRVCLLLASHAPINRIVAGHVPRPTVVKVGGRVDLAVDLTKVRVGMHVLMYTGSQVVARGVVEDLATGAATARVLHATTAALEQGARAQFGEPGAFGGVSLGVGIAAGR
jgi:hypothetical protein